MAHMFMCGIPDNLVAASVDWHLASLQQRLTELQKELKKKPRGDENLEVLPIRTTAMTSFQFKNAAARAVNR